jgi:hypothetical protein
MLLLGDEILAYWSSNKRRALGAQQDKPSKLFRDARRIIKHRWDKIGQLVGVEQAAA